VNASARDRLLDRYLHGRLPADQEQRVYRLLLDDPEAAQRLAELSLVDCMLMTLTDQEQVWEDRSVRDVLGEVIEQDERVRVCEGTYLADHHREEIRIAAEMAFERFKEQEDRRQEELARRRYQARRRQLAVGAIAMIALVLVSLSVWLANRRPADPSKSRVAGEVSPPPLPTVAYLSRASGAHWHRKDVSPMPGTDLTAGRVFLDKGFVEITFDNDARLIVEAPSRMELIDERRVRLKRGTLTAHVPEQARGFEVETPSARVTDLGTEFALAVDNRGAADVHVLDGWVAASFIAPGQDEQQQVKALYQDHAMRFNARKGVMRAIDVDAERFARSWDEVLYRPSVQGNIRFERQIPPSLCVGRLEDNVFIRLFLERTDVVLETDTKVNIAEAGGYTSFGKTSDVLPAGTVVDSYLLHWDPGDISTSYRIASGQVTFRRPILGVIVGLDGLVAGDAGFGFPDADYSVKGVARGLEPSSHGETADTVILSEDRLTLGVTLQAKKQNGLDQLRVLVATPLSEER